MRNLRKKVTNLRNRLLKNYGPQNDITRVKAGYQYIMLLIISLALVTYVMVGIITGRFYLFGTLVAGLAVVSVSLYLLYNGRNRLSGHILVFLTMVLIHGEAISHSQVTHPMQRLDNFFLSFAIVFSSAALLSARSAIFYAFANLAVIIISMTLYTEVYSQQKLYTSLVSDVTIATLTVAVFVYYYAIHLERHFRVMSGKKNILYDRIRKKRRQLESTIKQLESSNANLKIANRKLEKSYYTMNLEQKMAYRVQQHFLTPPAEIVSGWDYYVRHLPMSMVSGDFYDLYFDEHLDGAGIFDVSGHGIASGLITMYARLVLRNLFYENIDKSLDVTLSRANQAITDKLQGSGFYITAALVRLEDEETLSYVNGGHCDLLVRPAEGTPYYAGREDFSNRGSILGFPGINTPFPVETLKLKSGDTLILHTDALLESTNSAEEMFGTENLLTALESINPGLPLSVQAEKLIEQLQTFCGRTTFDDDLTIVILRKT